MHLYLNFVCAYALAWRLTRSPAAAFAGAIVFGGSPFHSAHLGGHFNLLAAWILPVSALIAMEAGARAQLRPAAPATRVAVRTTRLTRRAD